MPEKREEQNQAGNGDSSENQEPEYVFDGYNVEFLEKIMLTSGGR